MRRVLLLAILAVSSCLIAAPHEESDAVIASIDGEAITLGDIMPLTLNLEKPLYASRKGEELATAIREIRLRVLDEMINQKLIIAEFNRTEPFTIPSQVVEGYIDDIAENMGIRSRSEFISEMRKADMNIDDVRKKATEQLAVQAMRSRHSFVHVNITPKEVYDYYKANASELGTPERWELSMILIAKKKENYSQLVELISKRLEGATIKDFAELATTYSSGPNASLGGGIGVLDRVNLRSEFVEYIENPEQGKFYGPIKTEEGDYFLAITKIIPENIPELKSVAEQIKNLLNGKLRREALQKYVEELRSKALIKYYL